jgi:hypothetical protein
MSFSHNDLKNIQGGKDTGGTGVVDITNFYHFSGGGEFNVTLGVSSIVEDPALTVDSLVFLMPKNSDAAALASAIGFSVEAGLGSFTATHGSAEATAGKFNYLFW